MRKGDRVKLKGREPIGYVKTMGSDNDWIRVDWDKGKEGPKYVHKFELDVIDETISISSSGRDSVARNCVKQCEQGNQQEQDLHRTILDKLESRKQGLTLYEIDNASNIKFQIETIFTYRSLPSIPGACWPT